MRRVTPRQPRRTQTLVAARRAALRGHAARTATPHDPHRSPRRAGRGGGREHRWCMRPAGRRTDVARPAARPVHRARSLRPDAASTTRSGRHRDIRAPARLARCDCQSDTDRRGEPCPDGTARARTGARTDRHDPYPGTDPGTDHACRGRRPRRRPERERGTSADRARTQVLAAAGTRHVRPARTGAVRATGAGNDRATCTGDHVATRTGDLWRPTGSRDDRATRSGYLRCAPSARDHRATRSGHLRRATGSGDDRAAGTGNAAHSATVRTP